MLWEVMITPAGSEIPERREVEAPDDLQAQERAAEAYCSETGAIAVTVTDVREIELAG